MTVLKKQIPIDLMGHLQGEALTVCLIARVRTKSGDLHGFTDLDVDLSYDPADVDPYGTGDDWGPLLHEALNGGFSIARLDSAADMTVDNSELSILPGTNAVTAPAMLAGYLDSADVRIYRVNYADLTMGHELVAAGKLGSARISESLGAVEFRSLIDLLKQPEADLYSIPCSHVFGGPNCPKTYVWVEGTVTAVDPDDPLRIFADTDLTPEDDEYVPGVVEWLTGDNTGAQMEIDQNTAGTFALALPMGYPIQLGDTFRVRRDCSKLWADAEKGCAYHWDETNRIRYHGGFPDIPIADAGAALIPGAQQYGAR